jgi:hypothetical protein
MLLNFGCRDNAVGVRLERIADQSVELETDLLRGRLKLHAIGLNHLPRTRLHRGGDLVFRNVSVAVEIVTQNLSDGLRAPLRRRDPTRLSMPCALTPRSPGLL